MNKLIDILFALKLAIIGDKNKVKFMMYLIDLCNEFPIYENHIKNMSSLKSDNTWYLDELYEFYKVNKDIRFKLDRDINMN